MILGIKFHDAMAQRGTKRLRYFRYFRYLAKSENSYLVTVIYFLSIGLIVPDECCPITCVYICVVLKSLCPSNS